MINFYFFCIEICILLIFISFSAASAGNRPLWDKRAYRVYTRLLSEKGQESALAALRPFLAKNTQKIKHEKILINTKKLANSSSELARKNNQKTEPQNYTKRGSHATTRLPHTRKNKIPKPTMQQTRKGS